MHNQVMAALEDFRVGESNRLGVGVAARLSRYLQVLTMDAMLYKAYGNYDAVWFNRVYRDRPLQMALEQKVWHDMRPGAVIICANLENPPPPSWFIINDSWGTEPEGLRRGVWAKPG